MLALDRPKLVEGLKHLMIMILRLFDQWKKNPMCILLLEPATAYLFFKDMHEDLMGGDENIVTLLE